MRGHAPIALVVARFSQSGPIRKDWSVDQGHVDQGHNAGGRRGKTQDSGLAVAWLRAACRLCKHKATRGRPRGAPTAGRPDRRPKFP